MICGFWIVKLILLKLKLNIIGILNVFEIEIFFL